MDKDVSDAFKALGRQMTEGFASVRKEIESVRADVESVRADVESVRADMATKEDLVQLRNDIRKDVRAELRDVRGAMPTETTDG